MKTTAVRLYGAGDLRLETFELPAIKADEVLVRIVSDSICMSTYKCAIQGTAHKRVPANVAEHPVIIGHEFSGDIVEVGENLGSQFQPGMKFALQPAINYKGSMASPGYSYEFFGGDATYCIIAPEAIEMGCLFEHTGKSYYEASLAEPMSCIIGAFHAAFHTKNGVYHHEMGIREGARWQYWPASVPWAWELSHMRCTVIASRGLWLSRMWMKPGLPARSCFLIQRK